MAYTYTDFLKKAAASLKAEANTASTSAQRALANQAADQLAAEET